jgi:hypothetical protein
LGTRGQPTLNAILAWESFVYIVAALKGDGRRRVIAYLENCLSAVEPDVHESDLVQSSRWRPALLQTTIACRNQETE